MTYVQGYPQDGSTLGQSKAQIRTNLDSTFQTLGVDHVNNNGDPGGKPRGYHTIAHFVPQAADPGAVAGYGQLYTKSISSIITDTALFWETGTGLIQQLTMNFTPVASTNGSSFLPGGIIVQWGTGSGMDGATVTFNMAFPTSIFGVTISQSATGGSPATQVIVSSDMNTKTQFRLRLNPNINITYSYVAFGK